MTDPQRNTQLANIEAATGMTVADFTAAVRATGLERHSQIVSYLKTEQGLTHGNANLIAHLVREQLAGGPASADARLEAQYAGSKSGLRAIYEALAEVAASQGDDVDVVVHKTGVSFRRRKQFALVEAPSSKRVRLGLNLPRTPPDSRVREVGRMCTHRLDLAELAEVDADVRSWIAESYAAAG